MDIYILDRNLNKVGLIDTYKSLIWAERYREVGDCELYLPATQENLDALKIGYWLRRYDSAMLCRIAKIEVDTDADNGNYLIVTGKDAKALLDQRIIWETQNFRGRLESAVRTLVSASLGSDAANERQIQNESGTVIFSLGPDAGLTAAETTQVSYKNLGEKVREFCNRYGWGYSVTESFGTFLFQLYAGADHSGDVVFSEEFENLIASRFVDDWTNLGNIAKVAGEGEGANRAVCVAGTADGINRYELFVDARDVTKEITFGELKEAYPLATGGVQGGHVGGDSATGYYYYEDALIIKLYSAEQETKLRAIYPNGNIIVTPAGRVFTATNVKIAEWTLGTGETLSDSTVVTLRGEIYDPYLYERGFLEIAKHGEKITFDGTISPNANYKFGEDYALGDIVTIENVYGVSARARITEVIEVDDGTGHYYTPKYQYEG